MSDGEELDVIVVGAGTAGLACAYELASAGMTVVVCERGDVAGSKNLTGGRLYLDPLRGMTGDLLDDAPFEREVVSESVVLTDDSASTTIRLDHEPSEGKPHSVTVLRAVLDQFLADKCGDKEAFVMPEQKVDGLIREGESVAGVVVAGEELRAKAVVAADGALSILAEEAGLRKERSTAHFGVGAKEIIRLDSKVIDERFNLEAGKGATRMYLGAVTRSLPGGGFIYTNKDSVSLGVVVQMEALNRLGGEDTISDFTEEFKNRADVAPLIAGGEVVEYGAHIIPEGGYDQVPTLGIPGMLLVGDAAGLVLNTGNILRGMDMAMASGVLAARSIIEHKESPATEACVQHYADALISSFVMQEMRAHRKAPEILANERIYEAYPAEITSMMRKLFRVDEAGSAVAVKKAFKEFRTNVGTWRALKDALKFLKL